MVALSDLRVGHTYYAVLWAGDIFRAVYLGEVTTFGQADYEFDLYEIDSNKRHVEGQTIEPRDLFPTLEEAKSACAQYVWNRAATYVSQAVNFLDRYLELVDCTPEQIQVYQTLKSFARPESARERILARPPK